MKVQISPEAIRMFREFHGTDPEGASRIQYTDPPSELIVLGVLTSFTYEPLPNSSKKGTEFVHEVGDLGGGKTNTIIYLCVGKDGKGLYLIPEGRRGWKGRYPVTNRRGVIG